MVGVTGSSYRRVGARLLLLPNGEQVGSISGGCLEGDLIRRAKWLIQNGPTVQHYSTTFDDTEDVPYGLGCGGELDVLIEGAESVEIRVLFSGVKRALSGGTVHVVTFLLGSAGSGLRRVSFSREDGVLDASPELTEEELRWAATLQPGEGGSGVFVERLDPPQRLLVFGAGEDARPMVALGAMLGWKVIVADGRLQLARAERFPKAEEVEVLSHGKMPEVKPDDAVVLMTHSYEQDRELLARVLPAKPRYLGLLGARHRSSLLVSEVALKIGWTVAQCCEQLYAPVGLDLGGDGAEAIALSVVAEIQACVQGKLAASQRLSAEDVAEQVMRGGASQYLQVQCALGAADSA